MWGVFRNTPCSIERVCYALFESETQAQFCANDFRQDNMDDGYYVLCIDSLKDLAKYIVYGVQP